MKALVENNANCDVGTLKPQIKANTVCSGLCSQCVVLQVCVGDLPIDMVFGTARIDKHQRIGKHQRRCIKALVSHTQQLFYASGKIRVVKEVWLSL